MPNYKEMYLTLFRKISDVIEELEKIQTVTEEIYIETCDDIAENYIICK